MVKEGSACFNCATFVQFASFRQTLGTAFTKLFCQGHELCVATGEVKSTRCVFSLKKKILFGIHECAVSEYIKLSSPKSLPYRTNIIPSAPAPAGERVQKSKYYV